MVKDVTPTMEKSFSPALVSDGGTSTMTVTIVNRTDLLAKNDFSFTDTLDPGLTIAGAPTTTCDTAAGGTGGLAGTISASLNGNSLTATNLDLAKDQASCTVSVLVKASGEKTYSNGAANLDPVTFLDEPTDPATLTVRDPRITVTKALGSGRVKAADSSARRSGPDRPRAPSWPAPPPPAPGTPWAVPAPRNIAPPPGPRTTSPRPPPAERT